MASTLPEILAMPPAAQANIWAKVEDDLLLDLDLDIGRDIRVSDPVRVWAAGRLEKAGVVVMTPCGGSAGFSVARAHPIPFARKAA